jgi:hypothetical protein
VPAHRKGHVRKQQEVVYFKPEKEASTETNPAVTLILSSSFPNCEKIIFCCLSYPVHYFIMEDLAD